MEEQELKNMAAQLRKPSGKEGEELGKKMFESNGSMIRKTIDLLPVKKEDRVLEIGYGNGAHLDYLFQKESHIKYLGVDISETMQKEASENNRGRVEEGTVEFLLGDGIIIPLEDSQVDACFSVNTVYFWEDYEGVLREIKRVLKPGGYFCLGLGSKNFMDKLPFTQFGFRKFDPEEIQALLKENGFHISNHIVETEAVPEFLPGIKEREIIVVLAQKPL